MKSQNVVIVVTGQVLRILSFLRPSFFSGLTPYNEPILPICPIFEMFTH